MSLRGMSPWRNRRNRSLRIDLPFDDIMEFALALLSASPQELEQLGWSFADRKRLLDHFLASGKTAQGVPHDALGATPISLWLPRDDLERLQRFARREFPKRASKAAMLDRVLKILDAAGS